MASRSGNAAAALGLLSPSRTRGTIQIAFEELRRAFAAAHRYEELKIGRGADTSRGERGSKARQVFTEMYAANGTTIGASLTHSNGGSNELVQIG